MATKSEKEAERYAVQLVAILLAVLIAYCCSLAAGRNGTGLGRMIWDTCLHVGCVRKAKFNPATNISEEEFESLVKLTEAIEDATKAAISPEEQDAPLEMLLGDSSQLREQSDISVDDLDESSPGLQRSDSFIERTRRRTGKLAWFLESSGPRRLAALCSIGALIVMCIASAGLSGEYGTLRKIHWAKFVVLHNETTFMNETNVSRVDLNTAIDALENCSGTDFLSALTSDVQSISGIITNIGTDTIVSDDEDCAQERRAVSEIQEALMPYGTTIYLGLRKVAEKTTSGEQEIFNFVDERCSSLITENRCEFCDAALPGTFFTLLGLYAQILGVIFAISRCKDQNNGLCLHLMATFGSILAFSTVNTTPYLFETNCYSHITESRNTLDFSLGNADTLTRVAGLIILCQFVFHVLSQHDPDVPFLAGTPWRYCFDINGECLKKKKPLKENDETEFIQETDEDVIQTPLGPSISFLSRSPMPERHRSFSDLYAQHGESTQGKGAARNINSQLSLSVGADELGHKQDSGESPKVDIDDQSTVGAELDVVEMKQMPKKEGESKRDSLESGASDGSLKLPNLDILTEVSYL
eukprot:m.24415 g.24415  ORF g.24415 m.24415 type:complete len:586 (+) comp7605_c0_seq1:283-2040(+)